MKRLLPYIPPVLLLMAVPGLLIAFPGTMQAVFQHRLYPALPLTLLVACFILGWRFNHSRLALAAMLVGGLAFGTFLVPALQPEGVDSTAFIRLSGLCLPLMLLVFHFVKERGLLNMYGAFRLVLAAGVVALCLLLPQTTMSFLNRWLPNFLFESFRVAWFQFDLLPFAAGAVAALVMIAVQPRHDRFTGPYLALVLLAWMSATGLAAGAPGTPPPGWLPEVYSAVAHKVFLLGVTAAAAILLYALLEHAYGHAFRDQLTGLPGRRALEHRMAALRNRYTLAMVDIDHFKKVNDRYGHDTGDQALRFVAAKLSAFRKGTAYRYGGEEFTIIMSGNDAGKAVAHLDTLRKDIAAASFFVRSKGRPKKRRSGRKSRKRTNAPGKRLPLNVSIGVASGGKYDNPHAAIEAADKALYRAKKKGRNRVEKAG